jgi:hypothetical protein
MIDFMRSIFASLLHLCCLVDGMQFAYSSNNPTVGQSLVVTWTRDSQEPASFRLGLQNDDLHSDVDPEQIHDVKTNGQTTGTVSFKPTQPGYVYISIQYSNTILTIDELLDGREW